MVTTAVRPVRSTASRSSATCRTEDTADLDVSSQRGCEVGAGRMQPRQHGRGDAATAQRQRLPDGGDAEFGDPGRHRSARHLGGAVAVAVGLDDGHDLGRTGVLTQNPHVVRDRVEIDDCLGYLGRNLGSRRRGQRSRVHIHVTATNCPRTGPITT